MKKLFFIFFLCTIHSFLCTPVELSFTIPFRVTGLADKTTFFLRDNAHNEFVLKYHPRGPKRAIHDTLGAYVGKSIDININEVEIFSPDHPFNALFSTINPLSPSQNGITTLHSRVPGVQVADIKSMNDEICIKHGLCKEKHLNSVVKYKQLCDIVAFDLFIDNSDRNNRNLFFDAATGQFYAIDMDHGFKSALALINTPHDYNFNTTATRACDFLKTLKKRKLSSQEIKALKCVQHTLEILIHRNPPATLFAEWMDIAKKTGYAYSPREQEKIRKYLGYNAHEVNRLQSLLTTLTE